MHFQEFSKKLYTGLKQTINVAIISSLIISWQVYSLSNNNSFLNRLEYLLYDFRMQVAASFDNEPIVANDVAIIDVDEKSLRQEGRWPWSRSRIAALVKELADAGAAVVAFDVVFSEAEEAALIRAIKTRGITEDQSKSLNWLLAEWNPDEQFGEALQNIDTVLGFFLQRDDDMKVGQLRHPIADLPKDNVLIKSKGFTAAVPAIQKYSTTDGFVTTFFDIDGVIRRTPLIMNYQEQAYPSLALGAVMSYLFLNTLEIQFEQVGEVQDVASIKVTDKPIFTDAQGRVLVPYKKAGMHFDYISAGDILTKNFDPNSVAGKIIFVGTSAIGLVDLVNTPFTTGFPGVEVHALVAQTMLNGTFSYRPVWMPGALVVMEVLLTIVLILLLKERKPIIMLLMATGVVFILSISNLWIWLHWKIDFPICISLLLTLVLFVWYLVTGFIKEYKVEQQIKEMFAQYTPPAHIEKMLNNPDSYNMDGESKELTVLFADIRSFTSISEKLTASELKRFLNTFFTPITEVIFNNKGTIDKYVGDMVMAFWGAPVDDAGHRLHALITAERMLQIAEELSPKMVAEGLPEIHIGIGLNTGQMNVGDMGSEYRKAYTVLGDAVNLGSRLESLTKYYGVKTLVGEETIKGVDSYAFRLCDRIKVKGKAIPIDAFEPLGFIDQLTEEQREDLDAYHLAIKYYQTQLWVDAIEILEKLHNKQPDCKLYSLYLERIAYLKSQGVSTDWNGVFEHTSK